MRNQLFAAIAKAYPTDRMGTNKALSAIWRILFYAFSPSQSFVMKTEYYKIRAHPKKGTLTRAVIRRGYWEKTETKAFICHLEDVSYEEASTILRQPDREYADLIFIPQHTSL